MIPGLWLSEGGQSAAGAAIDQLLDFHPYAPKAHTLAAKKVNLYLFGLLNMYEYNWRKV
jgi:ribulose kinase